MVSGTRKLYPGLPGAARGLAVGYYDDKVHDGLIITFIDWDKDVVQFQGTVDRKLEDVDIRWRTASMNLGTLKDIATRGGRWAAYVNHDLGSQKLGHVRLMQFGDPKNTVPDAARLPERYPDTTAFGPGWAYVLEGEISMDTGEIVSIPERTEAKA